mmetsp:Transcript_7014/g.20319  ORF Transcript_7014/g.20319 Transcript_7014/m.20319 type:complete len:237 (-) Transcript_7014:234-944(-)
MSVVWRPSAPHRRTRNAPLQPTITSSHPHPPTYILKLRYMDVQRPTGNVCCLVAVGNTPTNMQFTSAADNHILTPTPTHPPTQASALEIHHHITVLVQPRGVFWRLAVDEGPEDDRQHLLRQTCHLDDAPSSRQGRITVSRRGQPVQEVPLCRRQLAEPPQLDVSDHLDHVVIEPNLLIGLPVVHKRRLEHCVQHRHSPLECQCDAMIASTHHVEGLVLSPHRHICRCRLDSKHNI